MTTWLDRASVLAVLTVCVLAIIRLWPAEVSQQGPGAGRALPAVGSKVATVEGVDYDVAPATVLLVINSTCQYCEKSIPFYQSLLRELQGKSTPVWAVSSESQEVLNLYLASHGLRQLRTASAAFSMFGVPGTPSILVVKRDSTLAGAWSGWLTPEREKQVISLLGSLDAS